MVRRVVVLAVVLIVTASLVEANLILENARIVWKGEGGSDIVLDREDASSLSLNAELDSQDVVLDGVSTQEFIADVLANGTLPAHFVHGTRFIGPTGDFATINEAIDWVKNNTPYGNIILRLQPGTHVMTGRVKIRDTGVHVMIIGDVNAPCDYNITCAGLICIEFERGARGVMSGVCVNSDRPITLRVKYGFLELDTVHLFGNMGVGIVALASDVFGDNFHIRGSISSGVVATSRSTVDLNNVTIVSSSQGSEGFSSSGLSFICAFDVFVRNFDNCLKAEYDAGINCGPSCTLEMCNNPSTSGGYVSIYYP